MITNAREFYEGNLLLFPAKYDQSDFYFIEREQSGRMGCTVIDMVKHRRPGKFRFDPICNIRVLCLLNRSLTSARFEVDS
jgi:exodeoxyribonuclease V alpha subunit